MRLEAFFVIHPTFLFSFGHKNWSGDQFFVVKTSLILLPVKYRIAQDITILSLDTERIRT